MRTRKTKKTPIRMPARVATRTRTMAHRAIQPSVASTLAGDAANLSVASPGRMRPVGTESATPTTPETVETAKGKALPLPKTTPARLRGGRRSSGRR